MLQHQPSRTAEYMAMFRASEHAKGAGRRVFTDPLAVALLPGNLRLSAKLLAVRPVGEMLTRYIATIRKVGLDLGITQESALAWGVFAPVARLGPGDLSGNYVGAQGSATLGVGVGGNVLVGGSANSIALQPLSVQGQVGVSIAAGLESLELRPGR